MVVLGGGRFLMSEVPLYENQGLLFKRGRKMEGPAGLFLAVLRFEVWGLGFGVWDLGFTV